MRIGEVAAASGVTVETLRYYERRGLLTAPARLSSGYRQYDPGAVHAVRFVKHAQDLGFTLTDIHSLLRLAEGGPDNCEDVRDLAQVKIDEVTAKVDRLTAIRSALEQLVSTCDLPRTDRVCPILADMDPAGRTVR
ncbi:heavy metal-responsive transcriptional regulator [Streptomyces hypolithicus]